MEVLDNYKSFPRDIQIKIMLQVIPFLDSMFNKQSTFNISPYSSFYELIMNVQKQRIEYKSTKWTVNTVDIDNQFDDGPETLAIEKELCWLYRLTKKGPRSIFYETKALLQMPCYNFNSLKDIFNTADTIVSTGKNSMCNVLDDTTIHEFCKFVMGNILPFKLKAYPVWKQHTDDVTPEYEIVKGSYLYEPIIIHRLLLFVLQCKDIDMTTRMNSYVGLCRMLYNRFNDHKLTPKMLFKLFTYEFNISVSELEELYFTMNDMCYLDFLKKITIFDEVLAHPEMKDIIPYFNKLLSNEEKLVENSKTTIISEVTENIILFGLKLTSEEQMNRFTEVSCKHQIIKHIKSMNNYIVCDALKDGTQSGDIVFTLTEDELLTLNGIDLSLAMTKYINNEGKMISFIILNQYDDFYIVFKIKGKESFFGINIGKSYLEVIEIDTGSEKCEYVFTDHEIDEACE